MPQLDLTVNNMRGIISAMETRAFSLDAVPRAAASHTFHAASLQLRLPAPPRRFYRHGWQSWSLSTWLDPSTAPSPIRAPEFRAKDEDPIYAMAQNHISSWVGAVELGDDDIVLVGALDLSGRLELEGAILKGFYEDGHEGDWLVLRGREAAVFSKYAALLANRFGRTKIQKIPRVWCSWYSLFGWIHEPILLKALAGLGDLPFDVFQIDDGWQIAHGDWDANRKFPSGMQAPAERIKATGRTAGLWLAPFMVMPDSSLARNHPEWLLRDEDGKPVVAGVTWSGTPLALDSAHPAVLEWVRDLIHKVRGWGYDYLKLDFLYAGAAPGKRHTDMPREVAYRNAMRIIREAAGDAYILACGAPIIPSLGLCDGIRVGPDVAPYWLNKPLAIWLNNPNDTSTQNAIRTSLHRLWLRQLVHVDPDVMYFRSRHNALKSSEAQLLRDLGTMTGFKATSDLPAWLNPQERESLREFLEAKPNVENVDRYRFAIDGREVDFGKVIPIPESTLQVPVWLAKNLGLLKIVRHQALPAILESLKIPNRN